MIVGIMLVVYVVENLALYGPLAAVGIPRIPRSAPLTEIVGLVGVLAIVGILKIVDRSKRAS